MPGGYEKAITIQAAIENIVRRRYLLPAIQRKFTWSTAQICTLFDSLMRGYPINTFMFWEVKDDQIKRDFRFYQFLENYCERFGENNPDFSTDGHGDFQAVIDGQQRLTSLYIGLKGTYAYKLQRKWWPKRRDDTVLPPRRLYLNLAAPLDDERNDEMMTYEFSFLTDQEAKRLDAGKVWFRVGEILNLAAVQTPDQVLDVVMGHLEQIGLTASPFARQTLTRLYFCVRLEPLIHFYNEQKQDIDHVLDIFIRTNHGGTPLSFSDLLMSIAIANWRKDARQQIDDLVDQIRFGSDLEFSISRDWVLKTALTLTDADVRFKVENFTGAQVQRIEDEWEDLKACMLATFRLLRTLGLNDASLRAKNAAIPIAYYLYHQDRDPEKGRKGRHTEIHKDRWREDRRRIAQWLHMALLKGVFGGQGDTLLTAMRKIMAAQPAAAGFPLAAIIEHFRGHSKDLRFDADFIDRLLRTQMEDASCFSILALLQPDLDYSRMLDKDHFHPASAFTEKALRARSFLSEVPASLAFFQDRENWNSILNLQLLDSSKNKTKRAQPLAEWLKTQPGLGLDALLIPPGTPLEFEAFPTFIDRRRAHLSSILAALGHEAARAEALAP